MFVETKSLISKELLLQHCCTRQQWDELGVPNKLTIETTVFHKEKHLKRIDTISIALTITVSCSKFFIILNKTSILVSVKIDLREESTLWMQSETSLPYKAEIQLP